jgi:hypothetical protein
MVTIMPELDAATIEQMSIAYFRDRKSTLAELAAPYTVEDLLRSLQNLRQGMTRLLNGLQEHQVAFSPDPNTYSLSEVITHLIAAQGNTYNGLIDISASTIPHIDPVPRGEGAGAEKGVSATTLQLRLKEATQKYVDVVKVTAKDTDETVTEVPFFGKVTAKGWLLFQIAHDLDHLKQAQVLRRSADFPRKVLA